MTKICIFGAGAIGSLLAHVFHRAGADVSLVARGAHLDAIRRKGLTLIQRDKSRTVQFEASDNPLVFGPQDYIVIALKAHSVPAIVDTFTPLLGEATAIVPAVNGLPWWYFYRAATGTDLDNQWIETVDPGGVQWNAFGPQRAIGCVLYPACEIREPGVVVHHGGDRLTVGEPNGARSERAQILCRLLQTGGLKSQLKNRIRDEIWLKLWGNCSFNPISALTGASLDRLGGDTACHALVREIMTECKSVGEALGVRFMIGIERRIQAGADIVGHKPSTRQDFEQGRPMELDALISSVQEVARRLNIATPRLDIVATLVRMQGEIAGLYERQMRVERLISERSTEDPSCLVDQG